ncbi:GNAT family N-acetyltransferase [bacterium]|nr:GNAT family N-acetyltransferase [bacterium]
MKESDFYKNLPRLETERLIIRKYTLEDVDDYFVFSSDPEVTKFLRWGPHPNQDYTREYILGVLDNYSDGKDSPWGIEHKAGKKIIGSVHIMQLDLFHKKAQIGFVLAKTYWGRGYMAEAVDKVFEYCFTRMQLNRIEGFCIPENHAGARVMAKIGMKLEGILRQYQYQKSDFWDFQIFSVLKSDYEALLA